MKKVNWIIEKYIFDEYEDKLVQAIQNSGNNVRIWDSSVSRFDKIEDLINKIYTAEDVVIMHGSLQMGRGMLRASSGYPGIFLTLENYECFNYYGYFGSYLLNEEYVMMGLNDIVRNKDRLFELFKTESLFIRPSNGYKTFTGQLLNKEKFDQEFEILIKSYGGLDLYTLCVIAPSQEIDEEYRFICIDGKVVSGAMYMDETNRKTWVAHFDKPTNNSLAKAFAEHVVVSQYQPDKAFTIDVARMKDGGYKLIEINSMCCANWYGNDIDIIVEHMNKLAIKEYNDIYE